MTKPKKKYCRCGIKLTGDCDGVLCRSCRLLPKISPTQKTIDTTMEARAHYFDAPELAKYENQWQNSQTAYDLTWPQVLKLREIQGGRCAFCGRIRFLVLDHDHKTDKARGYLCRGCNTKLSGHDDPEFVKRAVEYLTNPPADAVRPISPSK